MELERKRKRLYPDMPKLSSSSTSSSSASAAVASQDSSIIISSALPPRETPDPSDDPRPTTSAVAADDRNWVYGPSHSSDDFTSSDMSLNAMNGTRLPSIQPIPRRRKTLILNKKAMDIYLAGTTGG
ncbi:uncharacterized protein DMAD_10987 [Drosophila madeirensis]|uniref:Uncharacterized protein n=1 Tax=Drosophila madeirensis TaxID=30013 RepID=A0AAU9FBK0_DROMD